MARPRVFVSSTYYDLKNVRVALAAFVRELGYDVILNEAGSIAYGKSDPLDTYCYDEIRTCDIVVSIIGGRYGSTSSDGSSSISQKELRTALETGKQVYIFIDKDVLAEFGTYRRNKTASIKWAHVDNVAVYNFIDDLYELPINNAIFAFENSESIIDVLREQWSGLFQRMLQDRSLANQTAIAQELSQGLTTLNQILARSSSQAQAANPSEVSALGLIQHPVFARLKKLLHVSYRVFFISRSELEDWLKARNYFAVDSEKLDDPSVQEWIADKYKAATTVHPLLKVDNVIFDEDGNLRPAENIDWNDSLIRFVSYDPSADATVE